MMAKRIPTGDSVPGGLGLPKAGMDAIQKRVTPGALSDPDVALYYVDCVRVHQDARRNPLPHCFSDSPQ